MVRSILQHKEQLKRYIPAGVRKRMKYWIGNWRVKKIATAQKPIQKMPWGVNLFGAVSGASGLSEASRGVVNGLTQAGIPVHIYDFRNQIKCDGAPYQINIIHANPNQLPELTCQIPLESWAHRYNIGFWVWEQETLPAEWVRYLPLFDEIWTPSSFSASAIRKETDLPVQVIPHIINTKCDDKWDRKAFGLPEDKFLCLLVFDCDSVVERKNPEDGITAYKLAFEGKRAQAGLVIKARNLTTGIRRKFNALLSDWPNIYIISEDYSREQINSLIQSADVLVSLHRAEGFGLVLAEAMYLGTPVVATNWSGNTEFMNPSVACMVDAELVELSQAYPPFPKGSRWAQADIEQASRYILKLYEDQVFRDELSKKAKDFISEKLGTSVISSTISRRMREIQSLLDNIISEFKIRK